MAYLKGKISFNQVNTYLAKENYFCGYFKKKISCFKHKYAEEDSWLVKNGLSDGQIKYCLK